MNTARTIALTTLGMALFIKWLGQLCLIGPDPVPDAAAACETLTRLVTVVGLAVSGAFALLYTNHDRDG